MLPDSTQDTAIGIIFLILRFSLAGLLLAFVGWAFYILWKDLQQRSKEVFNPQIPLLTLLQPEDGKEIFRLEGFDAILGRDPLCDCYIQDETVSARHARFKYHHGQWWVEDLGSKNGTFLNDQPVKEPLVLVTADTLRCGQVSWEIKISEVDNLTQK